MAKKYNKNIIKFLGFLLLIPSLIFNFFILQKNQTEREKNMVNRQNSAFAIKSFFS